MDAPDGAEAVRLRALYADKARAELDSADPTPASAAVRWAGDPLGRVALVKGVPSEADRAAGSAFAGPDGDAAGKAAAALGLADGGLFLTCSRPDPALDAGARAERLALQLEAVDPAIVVATDAEASQDLAAAFGLDALTPGTPVTRLGRILLAVDGLEQSLSEPERKKRVWEQLKTLARPANRS